MSRFSDWFRCLLRRPPKTDDNAKEQFRQENVKLNKAVEGLTDQVKGIKHRQRNNRETMSSLMDDVLETLNREKRQ